MGKYYFNSTIKRKQCPSCELKNKLSGDEQAVKDGLKAKRNTSTSRKKHTKWKEKDLNAMIQHVQDNFCNPYIRARDINSFGQCISCNSSITQAGHRYCVGDFPGMRFLINNIHGQEISCNHFKSGNIDAFDRGLRYRHGDKYTDDLKQQSLIYLRGGHKWHRFDVIEIGITYEYLLKNKIWIFTQKEFNKYRIKINYES